MQKEETPHPYDREREKITNNRVKHKREKLESSQRNQKIHKTNCPSEKEKKQAGETEIEKVGKKGKEKIKRENKVNEKETIWKKGARRWGRWITSLMKQRSRE